MLAVLCLNGFQYRLTNTLEFRQSDSSGVKRLKLSLSAFNTLEDGAQYCRAAGSMKDHPYPVNPGF